MTRKSYKIREKKVSTVFGRPWLRRKEHINIDTKWPGIECSKVGPSDRLLLRCYKLLEVFDLHATVSFR